MGCETEEREWGQNTVSYIASESIKMPRVIHGTSGWKRLKCRFGKVRGG
jgi:hypothetical protein